MEVLITFGGTSASVPSAPRLGLSLDQRLALLAKLDATGDKHRIRCRLIRQAVKTVLGHPKDWPHVLTPEQAERVIDHANDLYRWSGLSTGLRDSKQHAAFNARARRMLTPSQPGDLLIFTDADLARATDLVRSLIPAATLDAINASPTCRAAFGSVRIDHAQLALALCTVAKNSLTSDGDCPVTALGGMFDFFKVRWTNSTLCTIVRLLREAGLIRYTHGGSYRPGQWCRSFAPLNQAWSLPFIQHLEPEPAADPPARFNPCRSSVEQGMKFTSSFDDDSDHFGMRYFEALALDFSHQLTNSHQNA